MTSSTDGTAANETLTRDFKRAMRRLAATITIITTRHDDRRYGMVATAVCSLGIAPPSLLVSVAESASLHRPLHAASRFSVNLLNREHAFLVGSFSGSEKGEARFGHGAWDTGPHDLPCLRDAQAVLICVTDRILPYAGHAIILARVETVWTASGVAPLVYADGRLACVDFLDAPASAAA